MKARSLFFLLALLAPSAPLSAHENCVFANQAVDTSFKGKAPSIASYKVFDKKREIKGVLTNGHLFELKSWSCNHYGWRGRLVIDAGETATPVQLDQAFAQLGQLFLDEADNRSLAEELKLHPIKIEQLPVVRNIPDSGYDQFFIKATALDEVILVEISFYQS